MANDTNAFNTIRDYSNLMLLLNVTRGIVKNSFPDYLNLFDSSIHEFVGEICKHTALSLKEQGHDDKSIHELMSLPDDCYKEINEIM